MTDEQLEEAKAFLLELDRLGGSCQECGAEYSMIRDLLDEVVKLRRRDASRKRSAEIVEQAEVTANSIIESCKVRK